MEIWQTIEKFPMYEASNEGRIRNYRLRHILTSITNYAGYQKVCVQREGRQYNEFVHKLVAETFLGEHPGMDVRHRDNDRSNNHVDNLYWTSRSSTIQDAYDRGSKIPYQSIAVRVIETGKEYATITECANDLGCARSDICKYLAGKSKHVKNFHFERI